MSNKFEKNLNFFAGSDVALAECHTDAKAHRCLVLSSEDSQRLRLSSPLPAGPRKSCTTLMGRSDSKS